MTLVPGQPLDATVLAVWGDRLINAEVVDTMGKHFVKMSATLVQEGDTLPTFGQADAEGNRTPGGYFQWMPYQQAQAANPENQVSQPDSAPAAIDHQTSGAVFLTEDPDHVKDEQPAATAG